MSFLRRLEAFVGTPLAEILDAPSRPDPEAAALALFHEVAASVPAYRSFLAENGVDPAAVREFHSLPLVTRDNYLKRYPLAERCRGGRLTACDFIAVSSGSTGEPTPWPRSTADELAIAIRFEQVFHDNFEADRRSTLAVVCFPLGTWIGGMFTAACCRHLALKGYPIVTVTPGNQKQEIHRVVQALAGQFEQVVLLGYPPFLKDVIDSGRHIEWRNVRMVLAGEVISEEWRALMAERAGMTRPLHDVASLYGTADAGILGNETPLSVAIRGFLSRDLEAARAFFGEARLPTLVQYDPLSRYFEVRDGTLLFSGDNGVPLIRYHISDTGGLASYEQTIDFCRARGFDPIAEVRKYGDRGLHTLPFAWVFGRSHFALSFYGANLFPETVAIGLEQPGVSDQVTGKFVMEIASDGDNNRELRLAVELADGGHPPPDLAERVAESVLETLRRLNSEFAAYVPRERQLPRVTLYPARHPDYFPVGVKHRYSR